MDPETFWVIIAFIGGGVTSSIIGHFTSLLLSRRYPIPYIVVDDKRKHPSVVVDSAKP